MPDEKTVHDNVVAFRKRYEDRKQNSPYLPEDVELRLGEEAGEDLRAVLQREIDLASMRWARGDRLLSQCEAPKEEDASVASASEACARVALQEAIRAVFWECGEPIPKADMPIRIVRLQEEFSAGLRRVLKDLGYV